MKAELGHGPWEKDYQPIGISKAEERASKLYPYENGVKGLICENSRQLFIQGYEQAEKDILALIESRFTEIIGDAQPKPTLRAELEKLIKKIKDGQD